MLSSFFVLSIIAFAKDTNSYTVDLSLTDASTVPFLPHLKATPYGSYLIQNLNFSFVNPIFAILNHTYGPLSNRGEAHITIISPPEWMAGLSSVLKMEEINQIALDNKIQGSPFKLLCIARQSQFNAPLSKRTYVYNILVENKNAIKIRELVHDLYISKGGDASNFNPYNIYPHITLGFDVDGKDWFPEDQVFKTKETCIADLTVLKGEDITM